MPARCQPIDAPAQFAAVAARVGEAVDVVDAQAVDQPFGDQLEDLAVGGFEHRRTFDAQAAEFVDVEEAPPVDVICGGAPTGEAIALPFEQLMQLLEAFCRGRVVMLKVALNRGKDLRVARQLPQLVLQRDRQRMRIGLVTQRAEAIREGFQRFRGLQQLAVIVRADREVMIIMLDMETACLRIETQFQRAFLQRDPVIAAKKRQQQLAFH